MPERAAAITSERAIGASRCELFVKRAAYVSGSDDDHREEHAIGDDGEHRRGGQFVKNAGHREADDTEREDRITKVCLA